MSFVRPFFGYRDQILIFINDPNPGVKKTVHAINEIMKLPEGDMPVVAFSPRKQNLTLYITTDDNEYEAMRARLGKHKVGKVCLYINKLADVDQAVLREMISHAASTVRAG